LCCGLATFIAVQVLLSVAMDRWRPALRDPLWGRKLAILRSRMAAEPGRPLAAVVGSSRTALGVKPDQLPALASGGDRLPIVFNLGLMGAGPVNELACLHRLLAAGVRPNQILLEIHPLLLHEERGFGELDVLDVNRLDWADLSVFARYVYDSGALYRRWLRSRLLPCVSHRVQIQMEWAPAWIEPDDRIELAMFEKVDCSGWMPHFRETVSEAEFRQGVELSVQGYELALREFRVTERPDRAVREILELCRSEDIAVGLFLMPEAGGFRAAYTKEIREKLDEYLSRLSQDYGVGVFDASAAEADASFADGHHLLPTGAAAFAAKFESGVLAPFLRQSEFAWGSTVDGRGNDSTRTARKRSVAEATLQR
jgi:hypothetical protein